MQALKELKKNERIREDIINKMFEISGHSVTYNDIKDRIDEWYMEWGMTEDERKEWIDWSINYLQKNHKMSKARAKLSILYFDLRVGLTDKK